MTNLPSLLPFTFTNAQLKRVIIRRELLDPEDEGIACAVWKSLFVLPIICQSKDRNTPADMRLITAVCPTREVGAKGDIWS